MRKITAKKNIMGAIRVRKGLSVRQLAQAIGKTSTALYRIEEGEAHPLPSTAKAICDALEREFDDIFDMKEEA